MAKKTTTTKPPKPRKARGADPDFPFGYLAGGARPRKRKPSGGGS